MPALPVRPVSVDGPIGATDVAPVQPPPTHDPGAGEPSAALDGPADRMAPTGGPYETRIARIAHWLMAGGLAVALHIGLLVAVTSPAHEAQAEADGSPLTVDIIDMSSAPASPSVDTPPGPEASAAEAQDTTPPVQQPQPQETPPAPTPPKPEVKPLEPIPDPAPASVPPPLSTPPLDPTPTTPVPPQPTPTASPADASNASVDSAPPPTATTGDHDATTHAGDHPTAGAAELSRWQSALVAHIERVRHFPKGVHGGSGGTVIVGFSLDQTGHLLSARIITSSRSASIDAEALATVHRADPFPAPPSGSDAHALTFTLPIRFQVR